MAFFNGVRYFQGGLLGGVFPFDAHQKYSVDDKDEGRARPIVNGKPNPLLDANRDPDPFGLAKDQANDESARFLTWAKENMKHCCCVEIFGEKECPAPK